MQKSESKVYTIEMTLQMDVASSKALALYGDRIMTFVQSFGHEFITPSLQDLVHQGMYGNPNLAILDTRITDAREVGHDCCPHCTQCESGNFSTGFHDESCIYYREKEKECKDGS